MMIFHAWSMLLVVASTLDRDQVTLSSIKFTFSANNRELSETGIHLEMLDPS